MRDRYEMELVQAFLAAGKPVFGICRGFQLLNVMHGGTLLQDIPTQRPDCAGAPRRAELRAPLPRHRDRARARAWRSCTQAQRRAKVNSIHHQGIKDLAPGFDIEARCPDDGMIEAIRRRGPGYLAAVQWHPEFHDTGDRHASTTLRCWPTSWPRRAPPRKD